MSLRRRLVIGMLILLVAGVLATDVVTYSSLRSFLLGRLDEQIDIAEDQTYAYVVSTYARDVHAGDSLALHDPSVWLTELAGPGGAESQQPSGIGIGQPAGADLPSRGRNGLGVYKTGRGAHLDPAILDARLSPDVYVEVIDANGSVVYQRPSGSRDAEDPPPILPARLPVQPLPSPHHFGSTHGVYHPDRPAFEVKARGMRGLHYRAQALALPGGTLVTLMALGPVNQTVSSLVHVELLVSLVVVLALVALTLWTVRLGLRPLDEMADTAGAIARGDLSRRIGLTDERSEVGRLGTALNGMLSQIEAAFQERTASEGRLRRFVADASHELRTPLTSIRGYAELLRKGAFDDEESRLRAAERIEREAVRMGVLVDDLLLLARLDQGRPLQLAPLDMTVLVAEAVEGAKVADPGHTFTLDTVALCWVRGDEGRLHQAVANLLRNASVHTPAGTTIHVTVSMERGMVVVGVADEGPGLTVEQQRRIFDRFYRVSTARTGAGAGLGLAIVAAVVRAHNGVTRVESEPGSGSTFLIEIPACGVTGQPAGAGVAMPGHEEVTLGVSGPRPLPGGCGRPSSLDLSAGEDSGHREESEDSSARARR